MNTKVQDVFEKAMRRSRPVYSGCDKETDSGRCNKPVKLAGQKGFVRCADHPVKKLWPDDGVEAAVRADAESASIEELEAASDILSREGK